jgi:hypothetical protein
MKKYLFTLASLVLALSAHAGEDAAHQKCEAFAEKLDNQTVVTIPVGRHICWHAKAVAQVMASTASGFLFAPVEDAGVESVLGFRALEPNRSMKLKLSDEQGRIFLEIQVNTVAAN